MVTAIVLIEATADAIAGLAPQVAAIAGVHEAHSVAGGLADIVAVVKVPDHDGIARVVTEGISKLDGVAKTQTLIAFRSFSEAEMDAGFEGFGD